MDGSFGVESGNPTLPKDHLCGYLTSSAESVRSIEMEKSMLLSLLQRVQPPFDLTAPGPLGNREPFGAFKRDHDCECVRIDVDGLLASLSNLDIAND
jgi:hypothetical protein